MTALPSAASFTGASVTEGDFKTAISNLLLYLSGQFGSTGVAIDAQAALGVIFGSAPVPKTGAYSVVTGDRGKTISCSGTFTVSLPDVATVGEGFSVAIANTGSGDITIDPASTQLIGGASTKTLDPHTMAMCSVVGGGWETVGSPATATTTRAGVVQLEDSTTSTSTTKAPTSNALKTAKEAADAAQASANTAQSTANSKVPVDSGYGGVGSICVGRINTSVASGATAAGSSIRPVSFDDAGVITTGALLTGTWRNIGAPTDTTYHVTTWQRVS